METKRTLPVIKKFIYENRLLLGVTALLIIGGLSMNLFFDLKKRVYVIGQVKKIYPASLRGGVSVEFDYIYNRQEYTNKVWKGNYKAVVGKAYLVNVPEGYPSHGFLNLAIPVPDSIKTSPPNGWDELPDFAKKKK